MNDYCEHIKACSECKKKLCIYCIEFCSGCPIEGCEKCYTKHLFKCPDCSQLLCPNETKKDDKGIERCPSCHFQKGN